MKEALILIFHLLTLVARLLGPGGGRAIIAENLLLKQQLLIHSRCRKRAPNLSVQDRALFGFWTLFLNPRRIARAAIIIRPSTLLRFHAALKQRKYRLLYSVRSCGKPGPKGPSTEVIAAVVAMKRRNPRYGCPRIAQQMNLALGHAKDSLWSIDFFRCESILLRSHWVLVVMDQYTRRIIGFAVRAGNIDGPTLCRMFNDAASKQGLPKYISSDNDPLLQYHRWRANMRVLDIEEIKSVPHVPLSHPFVERLIGSIRRDLLDHTFFWTSTDLENKLLHYQCYYNHSRSHSARSGSTPVQKPDSQVADINNYRWQPHCRGLMELPVAA